MNGLSNLPKTADGHIVSPRYLPKNSPTLKEWRTFCTTTPRSKWPSWLQADVDFMRSVRK